MQLTNDSFITIPHILKAVRKNYNNFQATPKKNVSVKIKGKGKVRPRTSHEGPEGE